MEFELSKIDWTAISSIVSLIMVITTFITLWVNSRQLKEMKRQWKDEHRPHIQVSIVVKNETFLVCVSNVGNRLATNVRLQFNEFFKETLFAKQLRDSFVEIENIPLIVLAQSSKYFYLMPILGFGTITYNTSKESFTDCEFEKWVEENKDAEIIVSCTYESEGSSDIYHSCFSTVLKHCFGHTAVVIDNEVDAILELNKTLRHIETIMKK